MALARIESIAVPAGLPPPPSGEPSQPTLPRSRPALHHPPTRKPSDAETSEPPLVRTPAAPSRCRSHPRSRAGRGLCLRLMLPSQACFLSGKQSEKNASKSSAVGNTRFSSFLRFALVGTASLVIDEPQMVKMAKAITRFPSDSTTKPVGFPDKLRYRRRSRCSNQPPGQQLPIATLRICRSNSTGDVHTPRPQNH